MRPEPQEATKEKMRKYAEKCREKTGTSAPPDTEISEAVITGLAAYIEELGRPLCPCNFYHNKQQEIKENGRRWLCACDEMKQFKYCHCLLFTTPDGLPITGPRRPDDLRHCVGPDPAEGEGRSEGALA